MASSRTRRKGFCPYSMPGREVTKASHDKLEAVYNPYVDFDGVRTLAALEAGRLLSWLG